MCFIYDEQNDIYEERYLQTRKRHRCEACGQWIAPKSEAKMCSGLFEGQWFRYYVCNRCERLTLAIVVHELNEGCGWGEAWCAPQELNEYLNDRTRYLDPDDPDDYEEYLKQEIRPLGMPTLQDCRRAVDDLHFRMTGYARPEGTERISVNHGLN